MNDALRPRPGYSRLRGTCASINSVGTNIGTMPRSRVPPERTDRPFRSTPSEQPSPEESLGFRIFLEELQEALEQLPPEQREVFVLREFHHKTFDEIGDMLDIGSNTAKSRMRYALKGLRKVLKHFNPGENGDDDAGRSGKQDS